MNGLKIPAPFQLREFYTPEILDLLKSVTLGSNGALYRHKMIEDRIKQLYNPLYLSLERNHRVLGNITLCRRPENWYIRYFAFDNLFQSSTQHQKPNRVNSLLKDAIHEFLNDVLEQQEAASLYAYIDPQNERSLRMGKDFGFQTVSKIATQTFSRIKLKKIEGVQKTGLTNFIQEKAASTFENYPFYFSHHTFNDSPFYTLTINNKIVAFAKTYQAQWEIIRFSGKNGATTRKMLPYIPFVRKLIQPDNFCFTVVDTVWCEGFNPDFIEQLFKGILFSEQQNALFWWVDQKEPIYTAIKDKLSWGFLNRLNGVQEADLMVKTADERLLTQFRQNPTYVTGIDFV